MKQFIFLFSLLITVSSCQKVIDIEVSDSDPKLVIDANYDAVKEEVLVKISKSISVFSNEEFPAVTDATVKITDKNGLVTPLVNQGDGIYLLENYTPIYNGEYTMEVEVEGTKYKAIDTLPAIVPLDSLSAKFQEKTFIFDAGYILYLHFQDPIGSNYYRVSRTVNGEYKDKTSAQLLFSDGKNDNEYKDVPLFPKIFQPQDTVKIQLYSYSKKTYTYFQELFDAVSGSEYSTAPANPVSTWSPDCLGNFATISYDVDSLVIGE